VVGHSDTIIFRKKSKSEVLQSMGITVGNLDSTTQNTFALRGTATKDLIQKIPD
jgi:hypothetical protein